MPCGPSFLGQVQRLNAALLVSKSEVPVGGTIAFIDDMFTMAAAVCKCGKAAASKPTSARRWAAIRTYWSLALKGYRSCGAMSLVASVWRAISSRLYFKTASLCRCLLVLQADARAPVLLRPDRARHKSPRAIGTDVLQDNINADGAERAFIAANSCVQGMRRQILVTHLTVWA